MRTLFLTLRIVAGLVAAIAIAAAIHFVLEPQRGVIDMHWGDRLVQFLEPKSFYFAIVIPFFFVVLPHSLTDVSWLQRALQAISRSAVVVGITVALARPVWTTTDDKVATVVLVDVSKSISDKQLDAARNYITTLDQGRGPDDLLRIITFAEHPVVVTEATSENGYGVKRHADADEGTDIQAAVQLAYGQFPRDYLPRIVVLSDGNQTGGDLFVESYRAQDFGVKVSWKTFPQDRVEEIRVVSLHIPEGVKQDEPFFVTAEVWATREDEVTLALYQGRILNPLDGKRKVKLREGINRIKFKAEVKDAGFARFSAKLLAATHDTEKKNNQAVMSTPVKGRPQILYVEGGRLRDPSAASYFTRALERQGMRVHARGPRGVPSTLEELRKFDLVMVSDVPVAFMGASQMSALERYVKGGGGLIMAGGEDSFGSGGYQRTTIERLMPVRFDSEKVREQPNVAIVLVIDKSGSMSGPKMEAAKESARATAEVLNRSDLIGVIAFDSRTSRVVRLQRAANRAQISSRIGRITPNGGTNIYPALRDAYSILQTANAKVKHVILLSDGQAPRNGIAELASEMRAARITISAVGIGDADRSLLSMITRRGDGRLYMTDDLAALPRIFMKETTEAQKSALVEDLVKVSVVKNSAPIWGTGVASAPPLHGYVSTKRKPSAEVILISDLGEPILARWRARGSLGWSVAWTSDIKNRWAVEWLRWGGYSRFWAQVVRSSMRGQRVGGYDMYAKVVDRRAEIVVDAVDSKDQFVNGLETELHIADPNKKFPKRVIAMQQTAAGRYSAEFDVDRYGSFNLTAVHRRDGQIVARSQAGVALPYPTEYLRTTPNDEPLKHAALVTGGVDGGEPKKVWAHQGESIKYTSDLWPWVLLFVAMLMILDLYLKRVRIFGYRTMKFG